MRREDTGEVVEILRPQKRSAEGGRVAREEPRSSQHEGDAEVADEATRQPLKTHKSAVEHDTRPPRSRFLVGTALALLGTGGVLGGAVAVGAHFGVPVPFVNDKPGIPVSTAARAQHGAPTQTAPFALAPPTLGTPEPSEKRNQGPSTAANDDPFDGEGMAVPAVTASATKPVEVKPAPAEPTPHAATEGSPDTPTSQALPGPQPQPVMSPSPSAAPLPSNAPPVSPSPDAALELEMAKQLKALDDHVAALQKNVDAIQDNVTATLNRGLGEFKGRLDELQHHEDQTDRALQASQSALAHPAHDHNAVAPVAPRNASITQPRQSAEASTPKAEPVHLPQFTVQAGAPGIAILQDEQGNASRVEVGSLIPGWGPVITITSSGSRWVVRTPKGLIH